MAARREEIRDEQGTIIRNTELFHETGLSLPTRTIYLGSATADDDGESGVDAKMAEHFLKSLHVLEQLKPDGEITTLMNNVGGDEYHGAAIYDAIKLSPCPITIVVRGHAMSMGSVILQAATKRVMGPSATQMIHYGTWGTNNHALTTMKNAKEGDRWNKWMEQLYLARIHEKQPKYTLGRLKKLLDHDTFLTAQQSIDLGLADEIG